MSDYQLAQINIGLPIEPLDRPRLADFVARRGPVNAVADAAPGFVWRMPPEDETTAVIRVLDDERVILNLSVWASVEALAEFVYHDPAHRGVLQRRREWFSAGREPLSVLWWVPSGHRPAVTEAEERLAYLHEHGPSTYAFTFGEPFGPPDRD